MAVTYLQGSFRQPVAATLRFRRDDTMATVDFAITAGTTWNSADELVAAWTAVIQADGNFGAAFTVRIENDKANHYGIVSVDTGGPDWLITWSQAGDGTVVRDWLGGDGATDAGSDGDPLPSYVKASYVARYGAVRIHRQETRRPRGHVVRVDGSSETQHGSDPSDNDEATLELALWTGHTGASLSYRAYSRLEEFVNSLWDLTGGGEPWSVFHQDDSQDAADQFVVRFDAEQFGLFPERVQGAQPYRLWRIAFPALRVESAPW